jgi:hypothetical protein
MPLKASKISYLGPTSARNLHSGESYKINKINELGGNGSQESGYWGELGHDAPYGQKVLRQKFIRVCRGHGSSDSWT